MKVHLSRRISIIWSQTNFLSLFFVNLEAELESGAEFRSGRKFDSVELSSKSHLNSVAQVLKIEMSNSVDI